ncbi:MAG: hypothetical protein ACE5GQ_04575 [Nitrospinales bacterium]
MARARKLNLQGIERFRAYLRALEKTPELTPPREILTDPIYSEEVNGQAHVEIIEFSNRIHLAEYLSRALDSIDSSVGVGNSGLWSWLSLFYFDQVCPKGLKSGERKAGMDYRHILEKGYRYQHRHLLAGPYATYQMYGEKARLLLHGPLHQESNIHHQLATRQEFITNRGIIEAVDALYFDSQHNRPKKGTLSKNKAGSLFRFIDVIRQLELTHDLYSMKAQGIISLLPDEFNGSGTS